MLVLCSIGCRHQRLLIASTGQTSDDKDPRLERHLRTRWSYIAGRRDHPSDKPVPYSLHHRQRRGERFLSGRLYVADCCWFLTLLRLQGPVADAIVNKVREKGGIITHEDLQNYSAIVQPALQSTYLSRKVYTMHAPTSGPVLLHMLNIMEHYDLSGEGMTGLNVHRLVEAIKCNYSHTVALRFCTDLGSWFLCANEGSGPCFPRRPGLSQQTPHKVVRNRSGCEYHRCKLLIFSHLSPFNLVTGHHPYPRVL